MMSMPGLFCLAGGPSSQHILIWAQMNRKIRSQAATVVGLFVWLAALPQTEALDLGNAIVITPPNLSVPEKKAVSMLLDEVQKRTQIRWATASDWPPSGQPVIG